MKMKFSFSILFAIQVALTFSQSNFCDCCTYHSLQYKQNEYEEIFPPEIIKKNLLKELLVTVSPKKEDTSLQKVQSSVVKFKVSLTYPEIKFIFNNQGYVTSVFWYNRMGKPHSLYKFERNASGKIIKETFYYLDSLERPIRNFGEEIKILIYDKSNLVKIKKLENGKELPDTKSEYVQYAYDLNNRIINETVHLYFEGSGESYNSITTKFSTDSLISNGKIEHRSGEKRSLAYSYLLKTVYDKNWKPLEEKWFDAKTGKLHEYFLYKYDQAGKLISYTVNAKGGECPETNGYVDLYTYASSGLIEMIKHSFDGKTCKLTFTYKK